MFESRYNTHKLKQFFVALCVLEPWWQNIRVFAPLRALRETLRCHSYGVLFSYLHLLIKLTLLRSYHYTSDVSSNSVILNLSDVVYYPSLWHFVSWSLGGKSFATLHPCEPCVKHFGVTPMEFYFQSVYLIIKVAPL